ncbi:MAG: LytTR family DNA-binding domain-containing protein [Flavobacteriaceae bacterium]|nr:LytTR family DNA-binding domain-containing protein [Flavobacteriaceae bacterium]
MNIIIIEDEKPAARRLSRMLDDIGFKSEVMLHSVAESVKWLKNNKHPDLILLDIQLSDGLSFEIFEQIEVKSAIIFTTAYDEYALKAFKLNSIDYLLKPIDEDELSEAIQKFENNNFRMNLGSFDLDQIKRLLANPLEKVYKERFTIKIGQHLKMISINDLVCFYSENKGTYIQTDENRHYLIDYTMDQLEEIIDPSVFFRINRKYLININFIFDIIAYSNSRLQIKLHNFKSDDLIVSREKVKDFKNWIN